MYIKPNAIVCAACFFTLTESLAFDYNANLDVGMKTNKHQMRLTAYDERVYINQKDTRKDFSQSFGYLAPEFLDINLYAEIPVIDNLYLQPYILAHLASFNAAVGAAFSYNISAEDESLKLSTYLDCYRMVFYDDISYVDSADFDIDFGTKLDIAINDYTSMFLKLNQPFIAKHDFNYKQETMVVNNRSHIALGVTVRLLADFGNTVDNNISVHIIQEPISIPVIDLVIEEPEEPIVEELVVKSKALPEEVIKDEEPQGWFAWLIEFIAGLFRF